ncbi:MAG: type VI secretion system tip protein TssI/VgrG [Thermoanaerobaculia bacterium]
MYSQKDRPIQINTPLGADVLLLQRFQGREAISEPFQFEVGMLSLDTAIDPKKLIGKAASIKLVLADGSYRIIHGMFSSFQQYERGEDKLVAYTGILVPWLWFLTLHYDCRIFQNKSVIDIIEQIFKDRGFSDYKIQTNGSYAKRDYCVQYRETDFNFVSRLMEEEGIFYYFEHTESKHTLILADKSSSLPPCPGKGKADYSSAWAGWLSEDVVLAITREHRAFTGKVTLQDYNFETPSTSLRANIGNDKYEVYDYPGDYQARGDGEKVAGIRLEQQEARQCTLQGKGNCRSFLPGYRFDLKSHYRDDMNTSYVLTAVVSKASDNTYRSVPDAEPFAYENFFEAIPKTVPYRPPFRARKSAVQGVQTAEVVGKAGEEIWVDKYGRVKVQFFWDREGKKDEKSSCWVRVSQSWAGKNWGWVTLPRIGQEVIVEFLEGDPDRPIITGRVYNAEQMPPYSLPANQTQSGIKSRSSKQGGTADFNEIRLEDKKGSEMVTIHAQKDMETTVEHDDKQTIEHNRTITVDGTHTETITGNTSIKITQGNLTLEISQGNETRTLKMGNRTTSFKMGNDSIKLDLGKSTTEAMQSIELKVGQSSIKLDQLGVTIKGIMIKVEAQAILEEKALMTQIKGDAMLIMKGGLTMIN